MSKNGSSSDEEDDRKPAAKSSIPDPPQTTLEQLISVQGKTLEKVRLLERRHSNTNRSERIREAHQPYHIHTADQRPSRLHAPDEIRTLRFTTEAGGVFDVDDPQLLAEQAAMLEQFARQRDQTSHSLADTASTTPSTIAPNYHHIPHQNSHDSHPQKREQRYQEPAINADCRWLPQNHKIRRHDALVPSKSPPREVPKSIDVPSPQEKSATSSPELVTKKSRDKTHDKKRTKTGLVEMYPGTYVQIHSTRRAWDAIANGQATIVRCSVCRKRFQIAKSAKVLYCINCSSLTSLDVPETSSSMPDEQSDQRIAARLQQAEFDIAKDKAAPENMYKQKKDDTGDKR